MRIDERNGLVPGDVAGVVVIEKLYEGLYAIRWQEWSEE